MYSCEQLAQSLSNFYLTAALQELIWGVIFLVATYHGVKWVRLTDEQIRPNDVGVASMLLALGATGIAGVLCLVAFGAAAWDGQRAWSPLVELPPYCFAGHPTTP